MIVSTLELDPSQQARVNQAAAGKPVLHQPLALLSPKDLAQVEILLTYGYDIPSEQLDRMPALQWIHIGQSGMDKLPMKALAQRNILLTNSRGINSTAIAEYAMSMMLNAVRRNYTFYEAQKACHWDLDTHLDELSGKTVGILGLGMVGRGLAQRARAFEMKVLGMEVTAQPVEGVEQIYLPSQKLELFAQCDFIVICMPLTPVTRHLVDAQAFAAMKPSAWVINVGRGPIIDEDALLAALQSGSPAGAALDVFQTEPLTRDHPLWTTPNVIVTPHIAGDHLASYMPRMMEILCRNLSAYPNVSSMINQVDVSRGF